MRDLTELNINEGGKPVTRPHPTPGQIAFIEQLIGRKLPQTYVDFLMSSNGGHPEVCDFSDRTEGSYEEWAVDHFFHISSELDSTESVVWNYRHRWPGAAREIFPIAADGGGNLVCLDLTEPGKDRVIVWVHDDPDLPIVEVADSFEEFIDSLTMGSESI